MPAIRSTPCTVEECAQPATRSCSRCLQPICWLHSATLNLRLGDHRYGRYCLPCISEARRHRRAMGCIDNLASLAIILVVCLFIIGMFAPNALRGLVGSLWQYYLLLPW